MHLERDIIRGKKFKRGELKKEAHEELEETKKGKAMEKALDKKKSGKKHKHEYKEDGTCKHCGEGKKDKFVEEDEEVTKEDREV